MYKSPILGVALLTEGTKPWLQVDEEWHVWLLEANAEPDFMQVCKQHLLYRV